MHAGRPVRDSHHARRPHGNRRRKRLWAIDTGAGNLGADPLDFLEHRGYSFGVENCEPSSGNSVVSPGLRHFLVCISAAWPQVLRQLHQLPGLFDEFVPLDPVGYPLPSPPACTGNNSDRNRCKPRLRKRAGLNCASPSSLLSWIAGTAPSGASSSRSKISFGAPAAKFIFTRNRCGILTSYASANPRLPPRPP